MKSFLFAFFVLTIPAAVAAPKECPSKGSVADCQKASVGDPCLTEQGGSGECVLQVIQDTAKEKKMRCICGDKEPASAPAPAEILPCAGSNTFGKFPKGGGCNTYGCWPSGGSCNQWGCTSEGLCTGLRCPVEIGTYRCKENFDERDFKVPK